MEWNQAMSAKSSVFNRLPIHLRGEIIQIGAVRMNDDWTPGEEFQIDVKPVYFNKMHYKVKKLTGIDILRADKAEKRDAKRLRMQEEEFKQKHEGVTEDNDMVLQFIEGMKQKDDLPDAKTD